MKKSIFALTAAIIISSTSAFAKPITSYNNGEPVKLEGLVDRVKNERSFVLNKDGRTVTIDITSKESVILKPGDYVRVSGVIDKNLFGTDINADKVEVRKNSVEALAEDMEGNTAESPSGATAYSISQLPQTGLVKLHGRVSDVDTEKQFTITDATGSIETKIKSADRAVITEGTNITVVGYVNSSKRTKSIDATSVIITDKLEPASGTIE